MGEVGLWQRGGGELLRELGEIETRMRREYAASLELIAELDARGVVAEVGYPNLGTLLRDVLRIDMREANRRLEHARAVADLPLVSGGTLPAALPLAATAARDGSVGADHLTVISGALGGLPPHVSDTDRDFAERTMVNAARELDAARLARVGRRVREWLHEDDTPPDQCEPAEPRNELHLIARANGRTAFRGELDREGSALLLTTIGSLAKPRPADTTGPDRRTAAERQGDALAELVRLAADTGALPSEAGERPHLLVTVPLAVLRDHGGSGPCRRPTFMTRRRTADPPPDGLTRHPMHKSALTAADHADGAAGPEYAVLDGAGRVDAETARRLACDSMAIPAVLGSRSEVLDLGRASYAVSTAIRRALIIRDRGCAFPGCDRPHRWCHSHHIRHWADGGTTEPDNLVLLCGQHHRLIHHSEWECAIRDGQPEFRPPGFVDHHRTPRRNLLHAS